jgi:hypothetical protein
MGYDITIGKLNTVLDLDEIISDQDADEYSYFINFMLDVMACEGKEPEGLISKDHTLYLGPHMATSYSSWEYFMQEYYPLLTLWQNGWSNPSSDGLIYLLNTKIVKESLSQLPCIIEMLEEGVNKDLMKWFHFWCNEAITRYGNEAAIIFR